MEPVRVEADGEVDGEVEDLPLLPEHWAQVGAALRSLYLGQFLATLGIPVVGFVLRAIGHRRLARHGPTAAVRRMELVRFAMQFLAVGFVLGALAFAFAGVAVLAFVLALVAVWLLDLVLWVRVGRALVAWAGSAQLVEEWRTVPRRTVVALAISGALGALIVASLFGDATGPGRFVVLVFVLPVASVLPLVPLLFTSWRTYRLFSTPLVAAWAADAPPPPTADDRT